MSDLELFYVVMSVFYLWECTHWLRNGTVPFVSWTDSMIRPRSSSSNTACRIEDEDEGRGRWAGSSLGRLFNISQPFFVSNSREGGLHFASPFPAAGTLLVTSDWPFAVSPSGVADSAGLVVHFADKPQFSTSRHRLRVNGQSFTKATSPAHARWLVNRLNQVAAAPEDQREARVSDWLSASLDSSAVATRLTEFNKAARLPSITAAVLMLFVFLAAPLVIWRWGLVLAWPWLVGALVLFCVVNSIAFFRAHKRLYPELDDERFTHFLMVLLFPPAGMRSRDALSRPLLERFHPLTVARELCRPARFEQFASRVVREARHPRPRQSSTNGDADAVWTWFNHRIRTEVERFVVHNNLGLDQLVAAPARAEADSRSYCPRCHAPFTLAEGTCSDCGVALVRFSPLDA